MNLVEETRFLTEGWGRKEGHIIPSEQTCAVLKAMLKISGAKTILEIGFNYGHSAFTFLSLDSELTYHSVDIGQYEHTLHNADQLKGLFGDRFEFTACDSKDLLPDLVSKYDMVFVDGDHTAHGMSSDLNLCNEGGAPFILLDDYVRCIGEELPRQLADHYLNKPDFPYQRELEVWYPATDRENCMLLMRRYENV